MTLTSGLTIFHLCFICSSAEVLRILLPLNAPRIILLPVNDSLAIHPADPAAGIVYMLCQAHTHIGNITLSATPHIVHDMAVSGRDVGIVSMYQHASNITWYLYSNSIADVQVLVQLTYFTKEDPLVGGCNEEFNLENDSNIHLHAQSTKTTVQFQWSNTGVNSRTGKYPSCEDSKLQADLEYHVYVKYMQADCFDEDTYFNVMKQMLTADGVNRHGIWLKKLSKISGQKSRVDVSSYRHRGVVYNIVVTYKMNGVQTQAAYIPVASYSCDIVHADTCKQRDAAALVLSTVSGLVGLFICFFGHRFFKTENCLFGFLIFGLIFYQVLALETYISYYGMLVLACVSGLIGGTLLLGLWWYHGIPVLNVLLIGLVTGYLVSSVLFYTPFGNLAYLDTQFNYGSSFTCGVLLVPLLLLCFTRFLSIFSCTLVGSFLFVIMLDMYLQSELHAIILNSIRHITDRSYVKVLVTGPFTHHEMVLTVVWLLLLVGGTVFQMCRERKKAPFPPSPRQIHNRVRDLHDLMTRTRNTSPGREPLLSGDTTQNAPVHVDETESEEEYNQGHLDEIS